MSFNTPCAPAFSSRPRRSNNTASPSSSSGYSSAFGSPLSPHERQLLPQLMDLKVSKPKHLTQRMSRGSQSSTPASTQNRKSGSYKMTLGRKEVLTCPISGAPLISVEYHGRSEVWAYDTVSQKPQLHECKCLEPALLETEIEPLYSVFAGNEYVIFALNLKTQEIGQFVLCGATGGLVKVDRPNLIYKEGKLAYFMIIGEQKEYIQKNGDGWVKQRLTETGWVTLPAIPVVDEGTKAIESPVTKFPQLMVLSCPHLNHDILVFKTLKAGRLVNYRFDVAKKEFKHVECLKCFPLDIWKHRNQETMEKRVETPNKVNTRGLRFRRANQKKNGGIDNETPKRSNIKK